VLASSGCSTVDESNIRAPRRTGTMQTFMNRSMTARRLGSGSPAQTSAASSRSMTPVEKRRVINDPGSGLRGLDRRSQPHGDPFELSSVDLPFREVVGDKVQPGA